MTALSNLPSTLSKRTPVEICQDIYPRLGKAGNSGIGISPRLTRQHPSSKAQHTQI